MDDNETKQLADLGLARYIQQATALIGRGRKVGGNQFRHALATFAILIDYHQTDPVLLKASVIHDLFEEIEGYDLEKIKSIDDDGPEVVKLVYEVTRGNELKAKYLKTIMTEGSRNAKILKVADRISNLTDLNMDIFDVEYIKRYIYETEKYVLPIAIEVNNDMAVEVKDLIDRKRKLIND